MPGFARRARLGLPGPVVGQVVEALLDRHRGDLVLVIGQYLDQLHALAELIGAPIITGRTPNVERDELYGRFRAGELTTLIEKDDFVCTELLVHPRPFTIIKLALSGLVIEKNITAIDAVF